MLYEFCIDIYKSLFCLLYYFSFLHAISAYLLSIEKLNNFFILIVYPSPQILNILLHFNQPVIAQPTLQVQLLKYWNPLLLEFDPDNHAGSYCCCNMASTCLPSIQNFSFAECGPHCDLRMTICLRNSATGKKSCRVSATEIVAQAFVFSTDSSLFPEEPFPLLFSFSLDAPFTSVSMYIQ